MFKKNSPVNNEPVERRKHWSDRRSGEDRRHPERLQLTSHDCRSEQHRRASDLSGELSDGDIWWNKDAGRDK